MAKKKAPYGAKSKAIREYAAEHPDASNQEIANACKCSPNTVYSALAKKRTTKKKTVKKKSTPTTAARAAGVPKSPRKRKEMETMVGAIEAAKTLLTSLDTERAHELIDVLADNAK